VVGAYPLRTRQHACIAPCCLPPFQAHNGSGPAHGQYGEISRLPQGCNELRKEDEAEVTEDIGKAGTIIYFLHGDRDRVRSFS